MNPPQVLIERSALDALCDSTNVHHDAVAKAYGALLDEFEADKVLLVAVSDHLRPHRDWFGDHVRRGALAAIDTLHVGHQHRRAARRMTETEFDTALTLVMCDRHKVARLLTLDPQFTAYDLEVQLVSDGDDPAI